MDYKLTFENPVEPDDRTVRFLIDTYGENWDASLGDFIVTVLAPGVIEVIAKNVTAGDTLILLEDIGRDFDDLIYVSASERTKDGGSWFPTDLEDDDR